MPSGRSYKQGDIVKTMAGKTIEVVDTDAEGRMNRSLEDTGGGLLLVPQFTLAADTHKGTRPGFSTAAPPGRGVFHHCPQLKERR